MSDIFDIISQSVIGFFVLQLINVILSTLKSIITIKGSRWMAVLANAIFYGYYTFIIKAISDANFSLFGMKPILTAALITIITNIIGVYIALIITDRFKKEKLWLLKVSMKNDEYKAFVKDLFENNLKFVRISTEWDQINAIDIYLYSKDESRLARSLIKKYHTIKYCYMEAKTIL